jgi:hypothetical protein
MNDKGKLYPHTVKHGINQFDPSVSFIQHETSNQLLVNANALRIEFIDLEENQPVKQVL